MSHKTPSLTVESHLDRDINDTGEYIDPLKKNNEELA